jgi:hypothetical protein
LRGFRQIRFKLNHAKPTMFLSERVRLGVLTPAQDFFGMCGFSLNEITLGQTRFEFLVGLCIAVGCGSFDPNGACLLGDKARKACPALCLGRATPLGFILERVQIDFVVKDAAAYFAKFRPISIEPPLIHPTRNHTKSGSGFSHGPQFSGGICN